MAQLPRLDNAPINLVKLRNRAQEDLVEALDSMPGKKALVLDPKLSGPLALTAEISLLKEHGVEHLCHLGTEPLQTDCKNVLYISRPTLNLMKLIASHIQYHTRQKQQKQYSVFFSPRRSIVCEKVLEEERVRDVIKIGEYPLFTVVLEEDVLSLEHERAFKECHVDGDTTALWYLARTINNLQSLFGPIPNIKGKGKAAAQVFDILRRMQRENASAYPAAAESEIETLILVDRQVDMVTPMCTQLTYEGLIDEFFGINNGAVELDPDILGNEKNENEKSENKKKTKVPLNSNDKLYRELRDLNFGVVGQVLREKATTMKQDYVDVKTANQNFSELKSFVKKMNILPEMTRHIQIAQYLSAFTSKSSFMNKLQIEQTLVEGQSYDVCHDYIDEMICKQEPLVSVMRLLVLLSLTNNGLPKKHYDFFKREILHSYGFEHMFFLNNLERAGLFKKQETKTNWQAVKKVLRLAPTTDDDANPKDISYVYSGYAPLSIRLVQQALNGGWRSIDEIMKVLPGPTFERTGLQGSQSRSQSMENLNSEPAGTESVTGNGRRMLALVVFIGGVTFAEISALRFLTAQDFVKHDVIVLASKLVNGSSILETLQETPAAD